MKPQQIIAGLFASALALGCSAIVNPDPDRLGSDPDGGPTRDAGDVDAGDIDAGDIDAGDVGCPGGCDDSVACTDDTCESGTCAHTPDDGACGGGERCAPTVGCVPERCSGDAECDDGVFCNGTESCDAAAPGTGCVTGTPVECDDGFSCTTDACDEAMDACATSADDATCADALACTTDRCAPAMSGDASGCVRTPDDGACAMDFCVVGRVCDPTLGCSGGAPRDCADADPCNTETCAEATDTCDSTPLDADMDGDAASFVTTSPGGPIVMCAGGTDCDDGNPAVHPGATEACNRADDDCDGMVDEGCPVTILPDACGTASAIALDGSGRGVARGTLGALQDDYQTNAVCSARTGGRDAVYYVDLPAGRWDLTIDTIGSSADTVLGVGLSCDAAGLGAVCNDDYQSPRTSTESRIWLHRVGGFTATRVFILVDGYDSSATGGYVLNVQRRSATTDSCFTTSMDISGGGTVLGFQTRFGSSERGSCQGAFDGSPEAVFQLSGPASGAVDFDVYSRDFVPDIYLRSGACRGGTERGCVIGAGVGGGVNLASLRRTVTAGGSYHFFVDGGRTTYAIYFQPY